MELTRQLWRKIDRQESKMTNTITPARRPTPRPNGTAPAAAITAQPAKTFAIRKLSSDNEGEKITLYADSGGGKTTLASTAPGPIFLAADDGVLKIYNPITGEANEGLVVPSFADLRDVLHQPGFFPDKPPGESTIVVDTATMYQQMGEQWVFDHYAIKEGKANTLRAYGWGEGYMHLQDTMRLLWSDLEPHVRAGRNVIIICQKISHRIATSQGNDYLQDGPDLFHGKAGANACSVRDDLVRWSDHVFKIDLKDALIPSTVVDAKGKPKAGKLMANTTDAKAIYTGGAAHFVAKSRPVRRNREEAYRIPLCIPFDHPADTSLWDYIFGGCEAAAE